MICLERPSSELPMLSVLRRSRSSVQIDHLRDRLKQLVTNLRCTSTSVAKLDTGNMEWTLKPTKLDLKKPVPSDMHIARAVQGKPIDELCREINVSEYEPMGKYKAKLTRKVCTGEALANMQRGGYVVVTGVTPTAMGEGKSTMTLGLAQALSAHCKRKTIACIRQPSQGPTFGLKGGAAGGGYSQVWPMDEFNLHLTGDIHAITAANNLIAAAIDARMFHESTQNDEDLFRRLVSKPDEPGKRLAFTSVQRMRLRKLGIDDSLEPDQLDAQQRRKFARLNIDPATISVNRVIDTNDRFLRRITIGQAPTEKNHTRETKFTISVASEIMAILALASDLSDVCERVGRMVIGFTRADDDTDSRPQPVTCDDLCVAGAVCALIKDAVHPTIMQTLEGSPVFVHCGPFANIAHGNSSIIADKLALELVQHDGFVVTEAGFASDVGFEKFMDIKCRYSGLRPDCAVLVTTLRALKQHGRDLLQDVTAPNDVAIEKGLVNMNAHIANIRRNFNVPVVVALNGFTGDTQAEFEFVRNKAIEAGASDCRAAFNWAEGGAGAVNLAQAIIQTCDDARRSSHSPPRLLYDDSLTNIEEKLRLVARKVYGADDVHLSDAVRAKCALLEQHGFGKLPICVAKTHLSISHDPKMKGAPSNYTFPIVDVNVSAGAGFVYALAGEISTMPGLPTRPAFFDITLDHESGLVEGLF